MKFLLLTYRDKKVWNRLSPTKQERLMLEGTQFAKQLEASGKFLGGSPLQSVATATSVRVRENRRLVTDGPFAETREQLGGFFMVDAKDLNEAISIAAKIPGARKGTVEVRPVMELAGLPTPSRALETSNSL